MADQNGDHDAHHERPRSARLDRPAATDEGDRPVVLANVFTVAPDDVESFLSAWADDARFFKAQPGFRSAQLFRGIAGSGTFLNHAVWESLADFRAAFGQPAFKERLAAYPDCTAAPHLMQPVAVPGICAG